MVYIPRSKYNIKNSITEWLVKEKAAFESSDDLFNIFIRRYRYEDNNDLTGEIGTQILEYEIACKAMIDKMHYMKSVGEVSLQDVDLYLLVWNEIEDIESELSVTPESTPSSDTFTIMQSDIIYLPADNGLYNIIEEPNPIYEGGELYYWELWLQRLGDES